MHFHRDRGWGGVHEKEEDLNLGSIVFEHIVFANVTVLYCSVFKCGHIQEYYDSH